MTFALHGHWQASDSAARTNAVLHLQGDTFAVQIAGDAKPSYQGNGQTLKISDRVGNIPRTLTLPDNSQFITQDNDALDQWIRQSQHKASNIGILHTLESKWRWVAIAFLFTLAFLITSLTWGLPWASDKIAHQMPPGANQALAEGTLKTLDKLIFEPSALPKDQQQEIRERFRNKLLPDDKEGFTYTLHFRHMPGGFTKDGVPNAFALPSGELVVTDRLVELAATPEELDAILLHEIGHVVHRHSMRQVIQSSALAVALIMITGDAAAVEEWTLALPSFLLESSYSRDFESEADRYAFEQMLARDMDPAYFGTMMKRITTDGNEERSEDEQALAEKAESALKYLSSHPSSPERIRQANEYSERFKAQTE